MLSRLAAIKNYISTTPAPNHQSTRKLLISKIFIYKYVHVHKFCSQLLVATFVYTDSVALLESFRALKS